MYLSEVQIRFYKAFNYDYLRKFDKSSKPEPWELMEDGSWYPFVPVRLEQDLTTIVGANESGKSQVLDAIEVLLGERPAHRTDFCRYSRFFLADRVERRPDLAGLFEGVGDDEAARVAAAAGMTESLGKRFVFLRSGDGTAKLFRSVNGSWQQEELTKKQASAVTGLLPRPFRLKSQVPLPNTVPLAFLAQGAKAAGPMASTASRAARQDRLAAIDALPVAARASAEALASHAASLFGAWFTKETDAESGEEDEHTTDERKNGASRLELADQLLIEIAGVGRPFFQDVVGAIRAGEDGYVDGVEGLINLALASRLDFKRWWTQDKDFSLQVSIRESDLAFVVGDRTGTRYSFGERSGGLSYFLSYFVQFLGHKPDPDRAEILLMDEPDAYLSSQAQQDLLRILRAFAYPDDPAVRGCQVAYVTHSPFLIDRNRASCIRVVEKGAGDEGTRVVHDAARNHYEPLRSAFGALVGESTFISGCNLMVEGMGDQVLLAGMARRLQAAGAERTDFLDLNSVTIVPAGGASQIPYLAYLARGRDVEKPAVIVLVDSDDAGDDVRAQIRKGGAYKKRLIDDDLVLQIGDPSLSAIVSDRSTGVVDIEDLIPIDIATKAVADYARSYAGHELSTAVTNGSCTESEGVLSTATASVAGAVGESFDVQKVGFARHVLKVIETPLESAIGEADLERLDENFRLVFRQLTLMQREAIRRVATSRRSSRFNRAVASFLDDFKDAASKTDVSIAFEEISHALDDSDEGDLVRSDLARLRRQHQLEVTPQSPVEDFADLRRSVEKLPHLGRLDSAVDAPIGFEDKGADASPVV